MRITRAAKVAAFPLIVLALVALVACQGAPGTKGDKGGQGDTGTQGDTGQKGPPGDTPLQIIATTDVILVNDGTAADNSVTVGSPESYNLTDLIAGGIGDVMYNATASDPVVVEHAAEGSPMITVSLNDDAASDEISYNTGWTIIVEATDMSGAPKSTSMLKVVRNRKPSTAGAKALDDLVIGTQADDRPEMHGWPGNVSNVILDCKTLNACKITLTDSEEGDDGQNHFNDHDDTVLTYSATSEDESKVMAMAVDDGAAIMIMGVAPTAVDGANAFMGADMTGVTITVTATDDGMLSASRTFKVIVNSQPTAHEDHALVDLTIDAEKTIDVSVFFADADTSTLTYSSPGEDTNAMDRSSPYVGVVFSDEDTLTLTPLSFGGPREVKVRVSEPDGGNANNEDSSVGQWLELKFTATNPG